MKFDTRQFPFEIGQLITDVSAGANLASIGQLTNDHDIIDIIDMIDTINTWDIIDIIDFIDLNDTINTFDTIHVIVMIDVVDSVDTINTVASIDMIDIMDVSGMIDAVVIDKDVCMNTDKERGSSMFIESGRILHSALPTRRTCTLLSTRSFGSVFLSCNLFPDTCLRCSEDSVGEGVCVCWIFALVASILVFSVISFSLAAAVLCSRFLSLFIVVLCACSLHLHAVSARPGNSSPDLRPQEAQVPVD